MKIDNIWIVTHPKINYRCELEDILFETSISGLELQFRGGLKIEEIVGVFTEHTEALDVAKTVSSAFSEYRNKIKKVTDNDQG